MRAKEKRAEATRNCTPFNHSLTSPGQSKMGWSQLTILFLPPGSCLAKTEENRLCFANGVFKALLTISQWVHLDSVEGSA